MNVQNVKSAESGAAVNVNSGSATFRAGTFNGNEGGRDIFVAANASVTVLTAPVMKAAAPAEAAMPFSMLSNAVETDAVFTGGSPAPAYVNPDISIFPANEEEEKRDSITTVDTLSETTMFSVIGSTDNGTETVRSYSLPVIVEVPANTADDVEDSTVAADDSDDAYSELLAALTISSDPESLPGKAAAFLDAWDLELAKMTGLV